MGVSLAFYGNLQITGDLPGSNTTVISDIPGSGSLKVELNDAPFTFPASKVKSITYVGGFEGSDVFTDLSSLIITDLIQTVGDNNIVTVGPGVSGVHFLGNNNTLNTIAGSYGGVFYNGGTGNTITGPGKFTVYP